MKTTEYISSTRFKTTVWYTLSFLFLEIFLGLIIYITLRTKLYSNLDSSITYEANLISKFVEENSFNITNFKPDSSYASKEELIYDVIYQAIVYNPRNTYIQIALDTTIIYKSDNLSATKICYPAAINNKVKLFDQEIPSLSSSKIRFAFIKTKNYSIVVGFPIHLINETLNNLIDTLLILFPIFLFLSFTGGLLIASKSLSRIDKIIKKTEHITTANLDEKIAGEEQNDEYGRLVKTINEMVARIKSSIEYMNQFSIYASHELKTPLTILRGETELALSSNYKIDEYKTVLKSNYEEILRMITILDNLLLISKIDHSLIELRYDEINLLDLINENLYKIIQAKKGAYYTNFIINCATPVYLFTLIGSCLIWLYII